MPWLMYVAQWIELWPENQTISGLIPSWGTCLCCRTDSPVGGAQEGQQHIDASFSPFLLLFPYF